MTSALPLRDLAAILLLALAALGALDGLYFHLYKLRLYRWRNTINEHLIHTLRALLFPLAVYLLLAKNFGGLALWVAIGVASIDLAIQQWDLIAERKARKRFDGLSSVEYSVHVWGTGLHVLALALILLAKPAAAFSLSSATVLTESSDLASTVAWLLIPGAIAIGLLHLALLHPSFREPSRPRQSSQQVAAEIGT